MVGASFDTCSSVTMAIQRNQPQRHVATLHCGSDGKDASKHSILTACKFVYKYICCTYTVDVLCLAYRYTRWATPAFVSNWKRRCRDIFAVYVSETQAMWWWYTRGFGFKTATWRVGSVVVRLGDITTAQNEYTAIFIIHSSRSHQPRETHKIKLLEMK